MTTAPMAKNARKRAARRAFHASEHAEPGSMPYTLKAVVYRDGKRHVLTFASMTAFKAYREEFYPGKAQRQLVLVSDLDTLDDSKGKANRSRMTNNGIGLGNETRSIRPANLDKSKPEHKAIASKPFNRDGHSATDNDAMTSLARDNARQALVRSGQVSAYTVKATVNNAKLKSFRLKAETLSK